MVASPADFAGTPWAPRWIAPKLGGHTAQILHEFARSDEAISALVAGGAVRLTAGE